MLGFEKSYYQSCSTSHPIVYYNVLLILFFSDEYDFLPIIEPAVNKNPFVVVDHKLGIQAWAVKILFQYAYEKLLRSNVSNRYASK